ncbi:MAG TPA: MmcQ/YjbR family DNA-binding protein [Terriglobales bacterium]|nr:MmcQ/YjbR family DNA-binding protein [Terriglobales bacterium]
MTFEGLRAIAMALPEVEEGTSWGTPAFKVRKKMICRIHDKLSDVLVVRIDMADREYLIGARPDVYFTLPHYDGYPAVLVRLSAVDGDELRRLLTAAWRFVAPPKLVASLDARG